MAKKVDPLAMVAAAAKKKPAKKSKSKTPVVDIDDEAVKDAVVKWKDAKQREKDAKTEREMLEEGMRPAAMEARRKHIQDNQEHTSAVKVNCDGEVVTMKTSKAYSEISTDNEDELREIFGEDFDRLFGTCTKIEFKAKFATDPEVLQAVIDAVGAERFTEIFDVSQAIKPMDTLIVERDLNADVAAKHDQAQEEGLVKPYKSSFTL
jgi:hypothetical protein